MMDAFAAVVSCSRMWSVVLCGVVWHRISLHCDYVSDRSELLFLFLCCDVSRLASLLAASHELHMQSHSPPPRPLLKEAVAMHPSLPLTFQDGIQRDGDLANRMAGIFGAHASLGHVEGGGGDEGDWAGTYQSSTGPQNLRAARVETMSGGGMDGTRGGSSGGNASNELQEYIELMALQKLAKRAKRGDGGDGEAPPACLGGSMSLHASAIAAMAVIVEELTSELMERWREGIRRRCDGGGGGEGGLEKAIGGPLAPLTEGDGQAWEEIVRREATLQARGMDLKGLPADKEEISGVWHECEALLALSNRLEVTHRIVNTYTHTHVQTDRRTDIQI